MTAPAATGEQSPCNVTSLARPTMLLSGDSANAITPTAGQTPYSPLSTEGSISFLTSLLSRPLRLTLIDRRVLIGYLASVDHSQNIILSHAEEFPAPAPPLEEQSAEERAIRASVEMYWPKSQGFGGNGPRGDGWGGRGLGMVLVQGEKVVKVELMKDDEEVGPDGAPKNQESEMEEVGAINGTGWGGMEYI